jgi:hypothetical protein
LSMVSWAAWQTAGMKSGRRSSNEQESIRKVKEVYGCRCAQRTPQQAQPHISEWF